MKTANARAVLFTLFLGALLVQVTALFLMRHAMWPDEFQALLLKLISIYSVPLAVVAGNLLAQPRAGSESVTAALAWSAILLTLVWNLLLVARSVGFAMAKHDSVTSLISYLDSVAAASSFLIAGVLAFFFEKTAVARN